MNVMEHITLDDLDADQRQLAELIGIESYRKLILTYAGTYLYIPKLDAFERMVRDEKIKRDFNGYNYKYLAHKYGLTEISIRNIVADTKKEMRDQPLDGQISF